MGCPFPPKIWPFSCGIGTPFNLWFFGAIRTDNANGISIGSAVFPATTVECPYTLQWDAHSPPKFAPSHGGSEPQSNTWCLGPTQVLNPNGISIGSAVFAGLTSVTDRATDRPTDRQTDHATQCLSIDRIYVRSTAMRSNNNAKVLRKMNVPRAAKLPIDLVAVSHLHT